MTENELFEKIEASETLEEALAMMNENGVSVTEEELNDFASSLAPDELNEADLDSVAGGGILRTSMQHAKATGILLRAYYDTVKYGDATRTYSKEKIYESARTLGLE